MLSSEGEVPLRFVTVTVSHSVTAPRGASFVRLLIFVSSVFCVLEAATAKLDALQREVSGLSELQKK